MLLKGKVALVTGASRGIGAATARMLSRHGASVAVNYCRSLHAARNVVSEIDSEGGNALSVRADVTNMNQVESMSRKVEETLGPIDILVLNASIPFPVLPFLQTPWKDFESKLVGEMKAAFFCCKAVVPAMVERKRGCIIGISSGLSRVAGQGLSANSTAKSGLDAFLKSLALELGPSGIRVNVVAPGITETDATSFLSKREKAASALSTPLKRIGVPEDVAGAVLLLASDEARFVSGAYLPVSGGSQMT